MGKLETETRTFSCAAGLAERSTDDALR